MTTESGEPLLPTLATLRNMETADILELRVLVDEWFGDQVEEFRQRAEKVLAERTKK